MTGEQRRDIEAALAKAREVLAGADPVAAIRDECETHGIRVIDDAISLRDAARLLDLNYSYLRTLPIGEHFGRGRRARVQLLEVARFRRGNP